MWFALILLVLPFVYAFEEGEVYSQQQIDNFNFDGITYVELDCRSENLIYFRGETVYHFYSCLNLQRKNITHYEVNREFYNIPITIDQMQWCVDTYGLETCKQHYNNFLQQGWTIPKVAQIIAHLKNLQQDYLPENIRQWLENRILFP